MIYLFLIFVNGGRIKKIAHYHCGFCTETEIFLWAHGASPHRALRGSASLRPLRGCCRTPPIPCASPPLVPRSGSLCEKSIRHIRLLYGVLPHRASNIKARDKTRLKHPSPCRPPSNKQGGFHMRLRWSKMTAFLGFVSKDFGELGSLLRAYPRLRPAQTVGRRHSRTPPL
jgi:hypothetical protein